MPDSQPKRLIEVDLPIKKVSAQARREKSIRHGHISTLHIWWARRPLAACRAVILGGLLPDPADDACPQPFRDAALKALAPLPGKMRPADDRLGLRQAILDFIADFSDWDRSADPTYLKAARALVAAAYPDGSPTVLDPFAGGGAIPLEGLRVGGAVWANEINPVAVQILKAALIDGPRDGQALAALLRQRSTEIQESLARRLSRVYLTDSVQPHVYLWAHTARCEGPVCGLTVPLIRDLQLVRRPGHEVAVALERRGMATETHLLTGPSAKATRGRTVNNGSLLCLCGFVTPNSSLQKQAMAGKFGERLLGVVESTEGKGRRYRDPTEQDVEAVALAKRKLADRFGKEVAYIAAHEINPIRPSPRSRGVSAVTRYGVSDFSKLFLPRQLLAMLEVTSIASQTAREMGDERMARLLALTVGRLADRMTISTRWHSTRETVEGAFGGKALAWVWDFAELNPLSPASGGLAGAVEWVAEVLEHIGSCVLQPAEVGEGDARKMPLPDASIDAVITDPPYSDQIPYADMAEYFSIWHNLVLGLPDDSFELAKRDEIVINAADPGPNEVAKTAAYYRQSMQQALYEARRILKPQGIAVVVFADKSTAGWEALLQGLVDAGWTVTGSWPIDTEMGARMRGRNTAALASSVHLVCRPRPLDAGVGDWGSILRDLQPRVDEWMRRLSAEGVVGADAIFACLGPAIELYSRYERVETASGEPVPLGGHPATGDDYLSHVWAAVSRAALRTIFDEAEATGFEPDGRLAAVWLWTVAAPIAARNGTAKAEAEELEDADEGGASTLSKLTGYVLPYDTARKLAQPLGADLRVLTKDHSGAFEVKGSSARLLPVAERRKYLLEGDGDVPLPAPKRRGQVEMFAESLPPAPLGAVRPAATTLDRVNQAMLLFADERGEALRRLLVDDGVGQDGRFWRLADALSKLYPPSSQEKRWVDGVLARKKMLKL